jgi:hypothetical protein
MVTDGTSGSAFMTTQGTNAHYTWNGATWVEATSPVLDAQTAWQRPSDSNIWTGFSNGGSNPTKIAVYDDGTSSWASYNVAGHVWGVLVWSVTGLDSVPSSGSTWGTGLWGVLAWGGTTISAVATGYYVVRVTFTTDMKRTDPLALDDATNPGNYQFTGGYRVINAKSVSVVAANIFDVTVDEMQNLASYNLEASSLLVDDSGTPIAGTTASFSGFGELPKLISATNVSKGVIHADFSEAMATGRGLATAANYTISPVGNSKPVIVESINISKSIPTRAELRILGGGSPYLLTVTGVYDEAGNPIDPTRNSILFDISNPKGDELFEGEKVYFDTDLGVIELGYSELTSRHIEDLAILRAQSIAQETQFDLISDSIEESGVDRDDTRLNLFKK